MQTTLSVYISDILVLMKFSDKRSLNQH